MSLRKPITPRLSPWAQRSLAHLTESPRPSEAWRLPAGYGGGVGLRPRMTVSRLGGTVMRVTAAPNPEQPSTRALVSPFTAAVLQRVAATAELPKRYALAPRDVSGEPVSELPLPGVGAVQRRAQSGEGRGEMSLEALAALFAQEAGGAQMPAGSDAPGVQRAPDSAGAASMPAFDELASRVQQAQRGGFAAPEPRTDRPASGEPSTAGPTGASPPTVQRAAASQGRGFSVADQIRDRIRQAEVQREAAASSGAPPPAPTSAPAAPAQERRTSASPASTSIVGAGATGPPSERVQRSHADTPASPSPEFSEGDQERPELLPISTQEGDPGYSRAAALTERIQRIREGPRQPLKRSADPQDPNFSRVSALQERIQRASAARSAAGEAPVRPELPQSLDPSSQHYSRTADIRARIEQARISPRTASEAEPAIQRQPAAPPRQQSPAATPPSPATEPASQHETADAGGSMASAIRARIEAARARRESGESESGESGSGESGSGDSDSGGDTVDTGGTPSAPPASGEQVQRTEAAATPSPPPAPGAETGVQTDPQADTTPPARGSVAQEIRARIQAARERAESLPASPASAPADAPIQRQTITGAPSSAEESGPDAAEIAARIQATRDRATARPADSSPPPGQDAPSVQRTSTPDADASAASPSSADMTDVSQPGPVSPRAAAGRGGFSIANEIARRAQEPPVESGGAEPPGKGETPPAPSSSSPTVFSPTKSSRTEVQRSPAPPDGETQPTSAAPSSSPSTPQARPVRQGVLREGPGTASWQRPQVQRTRMFSRTEVLTPERKRPLSALLQPDTEAESLEPPAGGSSSETVQRSTGAETGQTIDHAPREDRDSGQEEDADGAPSTAALPGQVDGGQVDGGQIDVGVQRTTVAPAIEPDAPAGPPTATQEEAAATPARAPVPPSPVADPPGDAVQRTPVSRDDAPAADAPRSNQSSIPDSPATESPATESPPPEPVRPDSPASDLPATETTAPIQRQSEEPPPTPRQPDPPPAPGAQPPAPPDIQRRAESPARPEPATTSPSEGTPPASPAAGSPETISRQETGASSVPPASAEQRQSGASAPEMLDAAIQRAPAVTPESQPPVDAEDTAFQSTTASDPSMPEATETDAPAHPAPIQRTTAETRTEDSPAPPAPASPADAASHRDALDASQENLSAHRAAPPTALTETVSRQVDSPSAAPLDTLREDTPSEGSSPSEPASHGASQETPAGAETDIQTDVQANPQTDLHTDVHTDVQRTLDPAAPPSTRRPAEDAPPSASDAPAPASRTRQPDEVVDTRQRSDPPSSPTSSSTSSPSAPASPAETETPAAIQRTADDTGRDETGLDDTGLDDAGPLSSAREPQPAQQDEAMPGPSATEGGTADVPIQRAEASGAVDTPAPTPSRRAAEVEAGEIAGREAAVPRREDAEADIIRRSHDEGAETSSPATVQPPPQRPPSPERDSDFAPGDGSEEGAAPASSSSAAGSTAAPDVQRTSQPPPAPGERLAPPESIQRAPASRPDVQTQRPSPAREPVSVPPETALDAAEPTVSRPRGAPPTHLFDRLQRFVDAQMGTVQRQSAPAVSPVAAPSRTASSSMAPSSTDAASILAEQHAASRHLLQLERTSQEESARRAEQRRDRPLIQRTTDPRLLGARGKKSSRASPAVLPQARRGTVQRAWEDGEVDSSGRPLPLARIGMHRQRAPSAQPDTTQDSNTGDEFSGSVSSAPGGNALPSSTPAQSQVDQSVQDSLSTTSAFTSARPRRFGGGSPGGKRMDGPNLDEIARQILPLIRRMLAVERERRPSR